MARHTRQASDPLAPDPLVSGSRACSERPFALRSFSRQCAGSNARISPGPNTAARTFDEAGRLIRSGIEHTVRRSSWRCEASSASSAERRARPGKSYTLFRLCSTGNGPVAIASDRERGRASAQREGDILAFADIFITGCCFYRRSRCTAHGSTSIVPTKTAFARMSAR